MIRRDPLDLYAGVALGLTTGGFASLGLGPSGGIIVGGTAMIVWGFLVAAHQEGKP